MAVKTFPDLPESFTYPQVRDILSACGMLRWAERVTDKASGLGQYDIGIVTGRADHDWCVGFPFLRTGYSFERRSMVAYFLFKVCKDALKPTLLRARNKRPNLIEIFPISGCEFASRLTSLIAMFDALEKASNKKGKSITFHTKLPD